MPSRRAHKGLSRHFQASSFQQLKQSDMETKKLSNIEKMNEKLLKNYKNIQKQTELDSNEEKSNKEDQIDFCFLGNKSNFYLRTVWTFAMIFGFLAIVAAGHIWIIVLLTIIQVIVFKELIAIVNISDKEKKLPWFRTLNWYFLSTTLYFAYGESLIYYFKHIIIVNAFLFSVATHHRFISFILYVGGFIFFVMNLKKGHYKYQFTQFCWTHMILLLIVGQSHFIINNIFEGIFWFLLPTSLVICNDIFSYLCGKLFGKTQLIKLSPKKTVEGFIGGWICTVILGLTMGNIILHWNYMICPLRDLGATALIGLECVPNPTFMLQQFSVPKFLVSYLGFPYHTITIRPIEFHLMVFSTFASLIAPFGGFFASGLKRAFKIKDFGDSIPGHGGLTDRFDCQFINGFFVTHISVGSILQIAITSLTYDQQMKLSNSLYKYLVSQGVLPSTVLNCLKESAS
ncbi:hypothetical protein PORY_002646 [Pneumocystis oryctolagi]|uniref:Uncharacterized protein n=1 Tax=Pneumocystis oryctolagi TaxID=42067 RepID=A0ACB7CAP0_9ASCO|nr:hypothetical protein PORY_002646 [Pneumocystis oryctolagi]